MNICYAANRNYYKYLPTVINSVLTNNPSAKFYIFAEDDKIDCLNMDNITIINTSNYPKVVHENSPNHDERFSEMVFYKTICSWILPDIDKCIFLDVDTLCDGPLDELWNTDMTNHAYGMVLEAKQYWPIPDLTYFNAGVILMNLKMIREQQLADVQLWNLNTFKFQFLEQDVIVLNPQTHHLILPIPSKYNYAFCTTWCDKPIIKHYAGPTKQWAEETKDGLWQKYYVEKLTEDT